MEIPTVKVTMLGYEGSGKTTFMVGMYAAMSAGEGGYAVFTSDWDHGVELLDAWDRLMEDGKFPDYTDAGGFKEYKFVVNRGMVESLLTIDWVDYRGGAIIDPSTASDAAALHSRLTETDSVYLVLDGSVLGRWIADLTGGVNHASSRAGIRRELKVESMTSMLLRAIRTRMEAGRPAPSIVVLITKSDALHAAVHATGKSWAAAFADTQDAIRELLPAAFFPGVRTLINPVQLGEFGPGRNSANVVRPFGFKPPFLFTFVRYLADAIDAEERFLHAATKDQERTTEEIALLASRRFGASLLNRRRRGRLTETQQRLVEEAVRRKAVLENMRIQAAKLAAELAGLAVYEGGEPQR